MKINEGIQKWHNAQSRLILIVISVRRYYHHIFVHYSTVVHCAWCVHILRKLLFTINKIAIGGLWWHRNDTCHTILTSKMVPKSYSAPSLLPWSQSFKNKDRVKSKFQDEPSNGWVRQEYSRQTRDIYKM